MKIKKITLGLMDREGKVKFPEEMPGHELNEDHEMRKAATYLNKVHGKLFKSYSNSVERNVIVKSNLDIKFKNVVKLLSADGGVFVF